MLNSLLAVLVFTQTLLPQQWIKDSIEQYFANFEQVPITQLCTTTYIAYKDDALQVDLDGGLTRKAFEKKWAGKYQTKYAGINAGYFISGQDFGKIRVISCKAIASDKKNTWWRVEIRDTEFKITYHRDIRLVTEKGKYKIADVKEYD